MHSTLTVILLSILASVMSILVTFFFTSISDNKKLKRVTDDMAKNIKEYLLSHEATHHKKEVQDIVDDIVCKHQNTCPAATQFSQVQNDIRDIRTGLIFLVVKNNGDPRELGLVK